VLRYVEMVVLLRQRLVLEDNVQSVNNAGNVTQDRQQDVDEEVGTATTLKENSKRGEDDREYDLANIASSEVGHCD